jgi:hypothetical protein
MAVVVVVDVDTDKEWLSTVAGEVEGQPDEEIGIMAMHGSYLMALMQQILIDRLLARNGTSSVPTDVLT